MTSPDANHEPAELPATNMTRRAATAVTVAVLALSAAAGGYFAAQHGEPTLEDAAQRGADRGRQAGATAGAADGFAQGQREGRAQAYKAAYDTAKKTAYQAALRSGTDK